jgi:hypothetical protein
MADPSVLVGGLYDHFGWRVPGVRVPAEAGRLTETHEYFHRQLDDTTSYGSLVATVAALADAQSDGRWARILVDLREMSDLVHEAFAVGMSLLATQRSLAPLAEYPTYDRHVRVVQRLIGPTVHPWVALAALRAAATACMQCREPLVKATAGLGSFEPRSISRRERPNHRLAALLAGGYADAVAREQARSEIAHGRDPWWSPEGGVLLRPESMDGVSADTWADVHRRLLADAARIIAAAGGTMVPPDAHHDDLRALLERARELVPEGLTRIGALMESPGRDLLHGGPLDGQTIELTAAPRRAVVLPYGTVSAISGEEDDRHVFVVVTTAHRLRSAHKLDGVPLPDREVVSVARSTVFDGGERESVLLLMVDAAEQISDPVPVYVSVMSSAVAVSPEASATWMRAVDPDRVSLVMDTPATAALHRWCAEGAQFHTETRGVSMGDEEVRVIVGRLREPGRRSPLVVIPSTEFGARWFEAARTEDDLLREAVVDDEGLFDRESAHLDIVLTHLLLEERFLGTGSWRR